jgi:hypothetical protein
LADKKIERGQIERRADARKDELGARRRMGMSKNKLKFENTLFSVKVSKEDHS